MADNKANDTNHTATERPVDATTDNPAKESLNRNQPVRSTTSRDVRSTTAEAQKAHAQLKQEDAKADEKHAKVEQSRQKKDDKAQKVSEKVENLADKAKDKVDNLASNVQEKTSRASDKADEKANETHRKVEEGREERREQVSEAHHSSDDDSEEDKREDDSEEDGLDEVVSEQLEVVSKGDAYEVTYFQSLGDGMVKRAHFTTTDERQTYYDILGESRKRVRNEKAQRLESRDGRDSLESRGEDSRRCGGGADSDYHSRSGLKGDEGRSDGREDGRDSGYPSSLRGAFSKLFEVFNGAENERDSSRSSDKCHSCHCGDNEPLTRSQYENDRKRFAEVADAHRKPAHEAYDMLEENNRLLKQIAQHLNIGDSDLR